MSSRAAVAVVIPTHNRRPVLARTLAAVLGQRDIDLSVIVVDDRSDDDTWDYLHALDDDRCRVLRTPDGSGGAAAARNTGLAQVGDAAYVAFCDDDDLWAPEKLRLQVAALEGSDAAWSCTGAVTIDASGRICGHHRLGDGGDVLQRMLRADVIPGGGSSVVARRSLLERTGGFDETLETQHDWDLWVRLAERSPVVSIDRPLVAYRVWAGSMSWDVAPMDRTYRKIVDRHRHLEVGAPADPLAHQHFDAYLARMELRTRRRRAAATRHLRMAWRHRLPMQIAHAVGAAAAPGRTERWRARRELAEVPPAWRAEAEVWLCELAARFVPSQPIGGEIP